MQVAVQLDVVQTGDAAVKFLLTVRCTDGQGRHGRGEGLSEVEAEGLQIGSSLGREWGRTGVYVVGGPCYLQNM